MHPSSDRVQRALVLDALLVAELAAGRPLQWRDVAERYSISRATAFRWLSVWRAGQ